MLNKIINIMTILLTLCKNSIRVSSSKIIESSYNIPIKEEDINGIQYAISGLRGKDRTRNIDNGKCKALEI